MYLEFAGLPGSGKSTLSSALKRHLLTLPCHALSCNEAIIQCIRRRDDGPIKNMLKRFPSRIWWPLMGSKFALQEFVKLSSRQMEFISFMSKMLSESNLPELFIESVWNTVVKSFSEIQLVSQHIYESELVIMDEAFSQRCFTLFGYMENNISDDLISKYAKLAPISNQVFWIITNPRSCVERFMLRYQSRPLPYDFKLDKEELLNNFESGNSVLGRLTEALEGQGKCVYRIDGNSDINESIAEVCKVASGIWLEKFQV
jgi:thymidylate kinase